MPSRQIRQKEFRDIGSLPKSLYQGIPEDHRVFCCPFDVLLAFSEDEENQLQPTPESGCFAFRPFNERAHQFQVWSDGVTII
jgi:hypothetical protein